MAQVVILGAGVMGSAMSVPLASNGHNVDLVGTHLDENIVRSVQGNGLHPGLNCTLPPQVSAFAHTELANRVTDATQILVGCDARKSCESGY